MYEQLCYARGGIRFSIKEFTITPPAKEAVASEPGAPSAVADTSPPKPPVTRVWTDASGMRQVEATFVKLEDERALFRRQDGSEVTIPLNGLSSDDQEIVRKLAAQ